MRIIALAVLIILYSCKNKPSFTDIPKVQLDTNKLYGRWMILDALRNNRPTQTITGAIFEIQTNHLAHNMQGVDNVFLLTIKDSTLIASDQTRYNVEYLNDSLLIINTLIQNYKFRMSLKKQVVDARELTESDTLSQVQ